MSLRGALAFVEGMTPASQGLKALFLTSIRFRLSGSGSSNAIYHASGKQFAARAVLSPARSWTCRQCQTTSRGSLNRSLERPHIAVNTLSRSFTSSGRKAADTAPPPGTSSATPEARTLPETNHEKLPSHSQSRRSDVSKRLQTFMDGMLAKAAVAGQRVNIYTGTDYSGIESLRQQIVDQGRMFPPVHAENPLTSQQSRKSKLDTISSPRRETLTQSPTPNKPPHRKKSFHCWSARHPGHRPIWIATHL